MCAGNTHLALFERRCHLALDIFLKTPDKEPLDVFGPIIFRIGDGRGVQHVHQAGKTLPAPIMGGGRQHDQRVGAGGQ